MRLIGVSKRRSFDLMDSLRMEDLDDCSKFVKYCMFLSNFVVFVGGLAAFGVGLWALMDSTAVSTLLGTNVYIGSLYLLIPTGAVVSLVAFCGCLGAVREIKCLLILYAVVLTAGLVIMMVGGILGYAYKDKMRYTIEKQMHSTIKLYETDRYVQQMWDLTQETLECCGVTSVRDWSGDVPRSCCKEFENKKMDCQNFQTNLNSYTDGCLNVIEANVKEHASIIAATTLTVACVLVVGLLFTMSMFKLFWC